MLEAVTEDRLRTLGLTAFADEVRRQQQTPDCLPLTFDERLGLCVDAQWVARSNRQVARRIQEAHFRVAAAPEALQYATPREWNATLIRQLNQALWVPQHQTVLVTGPTGVGKTFLVCAWGTAACRRNARVRYTRLPRLLAAGLTAKQEGTWFAWLRHLQRFDLLILDEWAQAPLTTEESRDLLEILDDRYQTRATCIASQVPVDRWHDWFPDPTTADAVLDRIVHQAIQVPIRGESMRKVLSTRAASGTTDLTGSERDDRPSTPGQHLSD
ncbi:MAG: IS21-like element helper ATPase IstB [Thermaerobacter sp.]|nr:IS21-like element helper ATPase IstB [Thermaerobacter sp.]